MNIVIVGAGKVGRALAVQLSHEGHDITVIDNKTDKVSLLSNDIDAIALEGNGANYMVQQEAGAPSADLLIAVTGRDEVNMLCCLIAKKLGAQRTIARVRDPEYHQQLMFLRDEVGLSFALNPEQAAAAEISRILRFPSAIKVEPFAKGRAELVECRLASDSPLNGLALHRLREKYNVKVLVCSVERDEQIFIPTGDFVLQAGDRLNIAAAPPNIQHFFRSTGSLKRSVKNVIILGGGRISFYLAQQLLGMGILVKIIEQDYARCSELALMLPKAAVIHGDGTSQQLLHEEGILATDAFVALTGFDEENIILSMYAKNTCNVPTVVTKLSNDSFIPLLETSGLERFVLPKNLTSYQILQYVRAMSNSQGSNVETLHRIADEKVEALEFRVSEHSRCIGVALCDLPLKRNILIAGIIRNSRYIIPGGTDSILPKDSVIVVSQGHMLGDLDDILI